MNGGAIALGTIILLGVINLGVIVVMFMQFICKIIPAIIKKEMPLTRGVLTCLLWFVSVFALTLLVAYICLMVFDKYYY